MIWQPTFPALISLFLLPSVPVHTRALRDLLQQSCCLLAFLAGWQERAGFQSEQASTAGGGEQGRDGDRVDEALSSVSACRVA